jgi:hypothetical protein
MEREALLSDFEGARSEFVAAMAAVPDDALPYLRPGDDYALGGLAAHVEAIIRRYTAVLAAADAAGWSQVQAEDPPGLSVLDEQTRTGAWPGGCASALAGVAAAHDALLHQLQSLPDWERRAPVVYGEGEPYPTGAVEVIGWLRDHYREHVPQVQELLEEWRVSTASSA